MFAQHNADCMVKIQLPIIHGWRLSDRQQWLGKLNYLGNKGKWRNNTTIHTIQVEKRNYDFVTIFSSSKSLISFKWKLEWKNEEREAIGTKIKQLQFGFIDVVCVFRCHQSFGLTNNGAPSKSMWFISVEIERQRQRTWQLNRHSGDAIVWGLLKL